MANKKLAFEIGTEELPAFALHNATLKLPALMGDALDAAKIPHGEVEVCTTPRRLIALVANVPERTEAVDEEFKGPSVAIAYDDEGNLTKAALGFARGKGVEPQALERRDVDGTEYVFAIKHTDSLEVAELLPAVLESVITSIPWPKSQRWGTRREQFSRPVRWLVALLGDQVIPVEFAGIKADNRTRGHRFLAPGEKAVADAGSLIDVVRNAAVVPSEQEREQSIREQVRAIEQKTGLVAELPAKTMEEVVNLTEFPTVMVGEFDESFLAVPKEITVDAMLVHQRYFPLFNQDGTLSNKFLITSNGDPAFAENIVDGNERVVAARLYDAKFFYDEDLKAPLESYVDKLSTVVFQEALGTTRAKTDRMVKLAGFMANDAGLSGQEVEEAKRAAYLAKADLVTSAVVEFTSVQGIMGRYYALAAGEDPIVADAIADHYRPRFAGDELPRSTVGMVVACADKLDSICGLFAVDQAPTGSSDPFALRRSAIGILSMLASGLSIELLPAIDEALSIYREDGLAFDFDETRAAVVDFMTTRVVVMLRDEGLPADVIEAVLASGVREPRTIAARARVLQEARANDPETFEDLATAYARANNLRDASLSDQVDDALLAADSRALNEAVARAEASLEDALAADDYQQALATLAALRGPIDAFFESVMVMDDDVAVRENNLRLLNKFVEVFANVADFGKMAKK